VTYFQYWHGKVLIWCPLLEFLRKYKWVIEIWFQMLPRIIPIYNECKTNIHLFLILLGASVFNKGWAKFSWYDAYICMTHISVWRTYLYDAHICMTHISIWRTYLYDAHIYMTHISIWCTYLYDAHICMTHISVWRTYLYDAHIYMTLISIWRNFL
jgi:hypothetical protein